MLKIEGLPRLRIRPNECCRWASVSLIILRGSDEVLLIKRTENARDPWSGNVAFPGGHYEASDRDLYETAVRETFEEVGIRLSYEDFVGVLEAGSPSNSEKTKVLPHVFVIPERPSTKINPGEVLYAFWLPLREKHRIVPYTFGDVYKGWAIEYRGEIIWGLTYRIIRELLKKANIAELP